MRRALPPAQLYSAMRGVNSFAFALVLTYELAYHTVVVGLTPLQLVLVGVVLESMTLLFEIPTGVIADSYSRRLAVVVGILLTGGGFLIEALIPTFAVVLLAQVIWGIGFTFYSGAETAWLIDEIGAEQAHPVLLRATQISQLLTIAGTLLGALLASASAPLPILVGAGLLLALGAALALTMPEEGFRPAPRGGMRRAEHLLTPLLESARFVRAHPMLWMILLLGVVIGLYAGGFDRLYTAHLLREAAFPTRWEITPVGWVGILNSAIAAGTLAGTEVIRRRCRTTDQAVLIRLLTGLYGGMVVGSLCFAAAPTPALAVVGFCLTQTLRSIGRPLLMLWINQNAERQIRATVISSYWQANALGQIAGSPLIGWVGTVASLRAALGVGALLYTAALPLMLAAQRRWRAEVAAQGGRPDAGGGSSPSAL